MGTAIVLVLLTIEAILLVAGVAGWFHHRRLVSCVRIGVLVLFVVLVAAGVIAWAPRYYGLTLWLLVLAVWGAWRFYRPVQPKRVGWRAVGWAGVALVTFLAASPILIFPEYTPVDPTGDLRVATTVRTVIDPSRVDPFAEHGQDRRLTFGVWYPDVSERAFPLVVFSHGSMGVRDSNLSLFNELASHGYVVISIDHTRHALYSRDTTGHGVWIDAGYLDALRRENARENPKQSLKYYHEWMAVRVGDVNFVLDRVLGHTAGDPVFAMVDSERIGLVGHSLGGAAMYGVGRMRDDIDAVIGLEAPYMTEIMGIEDGQFIWNPDPYPVPVLNIYSDSAWRHLDEWPQYERNREMLDDPAARNILLEGVGHLHLTDLSLSSPFLTRVLNGHPATGDAREALTELNGHVLRFFNTYLKGPGSSVKKR